MKTPKSNVAYKKVKNEIHVK